MSGLFSAIPSLAKGRVANSLAPTTQKVLNVAKLNDLNIRGGTTRDYVNATAVVSLGVLGFTATGPNAELGLYSALALFISLALVWRTSETPLFAFIVGYLWLQAGVTILQATAAGETVQAFSERGGLQDQAIILSLCSIVFLALGLRLGAGKVNKNMIIYMETLCASRTSKQWLKLYGYFALVGLGAGIAGLAAPSLNQIVLPITSLRWVVLYLIYIKAFKYRDGTKQAIWLGLLELIIGIGGFFADFQTVFIVLFCALLSVAARINLKSLTAGFVVVAIALTFGAAWSSIKVDYREFVSGGSKQQVVVVPYAERIDKLMTLTEQIDGEKLNEGFDRLFRRLTYVDFFGLTLNRVPSAIPHENGALMLDAFLRPLMPRAFFPNKSIIDDSQRTRLYSGANVAGVDEGTSISLGWPAELYVDFGAVWMMAAATFLGGCYGILYRIFVSRAGPAGAWGMGMATILLLPIAALETSLAKLIGGLVASAIIGIMMQRWVIPMISSSQTSPLSRRSKFKTSARIGQHGSPPQA